MLVRFLSQFNVRTKFLSMTVEGALTKAVNRDTCMVYAESPANPTTELTYLKKAAEAVETVGTCYYVTCRCPDLQ